MMLIDKFLLLGLNRKRAIECSLLICEEVLSELHYIGDSIVDSKDLNFWKITKQKLLDEKRRARV